MPFNKKYDETAAVDAKANSKIATRMLSSLSHEKVSPGMDLNWLSCTSAL